MRLNIIDMDLYFGFKMTFKTIEDIFCIGKTIGPVNEVFTRP